MRALVSLTKNYGTNIVWDDWILSTETAAHGLLSVSFIMDPSISPIVIHCSLIDVPNIHDAQRDTSSFKYRNFNLTNPNISSLKMYLGWM